MMILAWPTEAQSGRWVIHCAPAEVAEDRAPWEVSVSLSEHAVGDLGPYTVGEEGGPPTVEWAVAQRVEAIFAEEGYPSHQRALVAMVAGLYPLSTSAS